VSKKGLARSAPPQRCRSRFKVWYLFCYFCCARLSFLALFPHHTLPLESLKVADPWRILLDCLLGTSNSTCRHRVRPPTQTPLTTPYLNKWQEHSSDVGPQTWASPGLPTIKLHVLLTPPSTCVSFAHYFHPQFYHAHPGYHLFLPGLLQQPPS